MPQIAVIIPTFNSERTLRECLGSVIDQTLASTELIVIDRFSKDRTTQLAKAQGATVLQSEANRSRARNIGLEHSTSAAVVFIDSDMKAPPELLKQCSDALERHDAVVIPEVSTGIGFWAKCRQIERQAETKNSLLEAARGFRREAFMTLGGYNESLEAGEDWDIQNRARAIGLSIGRVDATIIHDEGQLSLPKVLAKKYFYGRTFSRYLATNPSVAFKQVNPVQRIIGPSLSIIPKNPSLGIGVLILTALEFTAAGAGHLFGSGLRKQIENSRRT